MIPNTLKKSRKSRRHRHRSYGRKVAESFGLVFGTPFLLFAIMAFSVQAVEHQAIQTHEFPARSSLAPDSSVPYMTSERPLRVAADH
jgi:hypothetical protein